jgi:hypothetical protein
LLLILRLLHHGKMLLLHKVRGQHVHLGWLQVTMSARMSWLCGGYIVSRQSQLVTACVTPASLHMPIGDRLLSWLACP